MTKAKCRRFKAWCVVICFILVIFGLGMLCGISIRSTSPQEESLIIDSTVTFQPEDDPQAWQANPAVPLSEDLQAITENLCDRYGVPYALLLAVMERESGFDPDAVSKTDDFGLMQINKVNFAGLLAHGINPLTYEGNIEAGCKILGGCIDRYGDIELALMAYNRGPAGARKLWDGGTYSTAYTRAVMTEYAKWMRVVIR